jgi:hypothetical protein
MARLAPGLTWAYTHPLTVLKCHGVPVTAHVRQRWRNIRGMAAPSAAALHESGAK